MPTTYESLKETFKNLCAERNRRINAGESCAELMTEIDIVVGRLKAIESAVPRYNPRSQVGRYIGLLAVLLLTSCQPKHCYQCFVDNVQQEVCGETDKTIEQWKAAHSRDRTDTVGTVLVVTVPIVECYR